MQETAPNTPGLWSRLFDFTPETDDITTRAKSRLLNRMALVIMISVGLVGIVDFYRHFIANFYIDSFEVAAIGTVLTTSSLIFILNRRGHYLTAARLLVFTAFIASFMDSLGGFIGLIYFISAVILAGIFLTQKEAIRVSLATIIYVTGYVLLNDQGSQNYTIFVPSFFFVLMMPLILTYMTHTRRLEEQRRAILEKANAQLRESERMLEQRVQERTVELEIARKEAVEARDQALEADRVKSQFLASMSHELRTPLNSILTFSELMAMGTFGDVNEEQEDYLNKMLFSGKHLLSLINDVLDITKIHSGMMKLFLEDDFDISKEAEMIAETTRKTLGDKPVELVTDIDQNIPLLQCDKRRIRQVIMNLLSNATKFTEEGTVTLSVKTRPSQVMVMVSDTGPGIEADQQDIIFEPFIQTENGIRHAGGTGLGLPISKRLIEEHGGHLWVESEPGEGTTLFFTLSLQAAITTHERETALA